MATKGRKTVAISCVGALAVLLAAVAAFWDDVAIEQHVWQLHSKDEEARISAARALAQMGLAVVPRLMRELRKFAYDRGPYSKPTSSRGVGVLGVVSGPAFVSGFGETLLRMGRPALLIAIGGLDDEHPVVRDVLTIVVAEYQARGTPAPDIDGQTSDTGRGFASLCLIPEREARDLLITVLDLLRDDLSEPADIRLAAAEMFENLNAKQEALGALHSLEARTAEIIEKLKARQAAANAE